MAPSSPHTLGHTPTRLAHNVVSRSVCSGLTFPLDNHVNGVRPEVQQPQMPFATPRASCGDDLQVTRPR